MQISSVFDSGNIECVSADNPADIRLNIRKDNGSDFYQWFYFRLTGARGIPVTLTIENAGKSAYPAGWKDYQAVVSSDRENWERAATRYENGELVIEHTPLADAVWFAYFAPYTMTRHDELIAACQHSETAKLDVIGRTLDGRDLDPSMALGFYCRAESDFDELCLELELMSTRAGSTPICTVCRKGDEDEKAPPSVKATSTEGGGPSVSENLSGADRDEARLSEDDDEDWEMI